MGGEAAGQQGGFVALVFPVNLFYNSSSNLWPLESLDGLQGAWRSVPAACGMARRSAYTAFAKTAYLVCNVLLLLEVGLSLELQVVIAGEGVRPPTTPSSPAHWPGKQSREGCSVLPLHPHTWRWGERCWLRTQPAAPGKHWGWGLRRLLARYPPTSPWDPVQAPTANCRV